MELSKRDSKMTKGIAIVFMILLHLFCKKTDLPYVPSFWIHDIPLVYYLGLFGDCCVVIYCFCSGYAHYLLCENEKEHYMKNNARRLLKLVINCWVIIIMFSIVGLVMGSKVIPNSFFSFIKNIFFIDSTYNGAWWFVQVYILLVLLSKQLYKLVNKFNSVFVFLFFVGVYLLSYLLRVNKIDFSFEIEVLDKLKYSLTLFGTSVFPYIIGMIFYKHKVMSYLRNRILNYSTWVVNIVSIIIIILLIVIHGFYQSLIIAPITGILFIIIFNLYKKSSIVEKVFVLLGKNSTNIWLTHMFFIFAPFEDLIFKLKYPLVILISMFIITMLLSFVINKLCAMLYKIINI